MTTNTEQSELDFSPPSTEGRRRKAAGQSSVLDRLGDAVVESINNIISVVASSRAEFSWNDVKAKLPEHIKAKLKEDGFVNANGALMTNAARKFGYKGVGFIESSDEDARGRPIRVWRAER